VLLALLEPKSPSHIPGRLTQLGKPVLILILLQIWAIWLKIARSERTLAQICVYIHHPHHHRRSASTIGTTADSPAVALTEALGSEVLVQVPGAYGGLGREGKGSSSFALSLLGGGRSAAKLVQNDFYIIGLRVIRLIYIIST